MTNPAETVLSPRFTEALAFAAALHAAQRRKLSRTPYLGHLLAGRGDRASGGGSEDEAIGALLHDAAEDQGGQATCDEIRRRFGDAVAQIVAECSDTLVEPKPPWRQRKESHLARLRTASASVRLVEVADKLDNARALLFEYRRRGESMWAHFRGGRDGTLWYYRAMIDVLRPHPLVDEIERTIDELERLMGKPR